MSTKIYDAYKWHGTLLELMDYLRNLRNQYKDEAVKELLKCKDEITKTFTKDGKFHVWALHEFIRKIEQENLCHMWNFKASAVIYPHGDCLYVQFFGLYLKDIKEHIGKTERLTDFHYQNSSDQPKGITKKDWRHREKIWDEIFPDYISTPAMAGLTFEFWCNSYLYDVLRQFYEETKKSVTT